MSSTTAADLAAPKVHLSLNVSDLGRSVAFYRVLLGIEPAKHRRDYAKFELTSPPLILSLVPQRPAPGGTLNHTGLRLAQAEDLVRVQARLEAAGIRTQREEGVECCYAKQTKFWVTDPDRTLWELYVFHEDTDEHGADDVPAVAQVAGPAATTAAERSVWQHRLADDLPVNIPHADDSLDEAMLSGGANRAGGGSDLRHLLAEAWRALRPGGEVRVHGLASDAPLAGPLPTLPGPAAEVRHVPVREDVLAAVRAAGFVGVCCEKLSLQGYFDLGGTPLRELLVAGRKPGFRPAAARHQAVYLGPLAQVTDDFGNVFRRGAATGLNIHDWLALKQGPVAAQFLLLTPPGANPAAP